MPELKTLKPTDKSFIANGKKYFITDKISIARWKEYEKLMPRITYGVGFEEMFKSHSKLYALLNQQKFADSAVIVHNLMNGIKEINDETRVHPSLLMCALLINREGEDAGAYSKEIQLEKIDDWQKEGMDILSFFAFALQSINGLKKTYLEYIANQAQETLTENKSKNS